MTGRNRWTAQAMPDLTGVNAVVTGANSGIGRATVQELARHGATVTLAVRDLDRGGEAVGAMRAELTAHPLPHRVAGELLLHAVDLADLASVRSFAAQWSGPLHLLVNNAGVMAVPRKETVDGFELQLGTNHLGHFALTGLMLPYLVRGARPGKAARVVTVSSSAHRFGKIDLTDLQGVRSYSKWKAYGQSKLANLMFTFELQRRLAAAGLSVAAYAAAPGLVATNLQAVGPQMAGQRVRGGLITTATGLIGQSPERGALPSLYAATVPDLEPGAFVGPDGPGAQRGYPTLIGTSASARDELLASGLWEASEGLTGIHYDFESLASR